jgi:hypothetical protein
MPPELLANESLLLGLTAEGSVEVEPVMELLLPLEPVAGGLGSVPELCPRAVSAKDNRTQNDT